MSSPINPLIATTLHLPKASRKGETPEVLERISLLTSNLYNINTIVHSAGIILLSVAR
ncbi:MAG: hypothetical protein ACO2O2_05250 [Acidilobaceae archaeon]